MVLSPALQEAPKPTELCLGTYGNLWGVHIRSQDVLDVESHTLPKDYRNFKGKELFKWVNPPPTGWLICSLDITWGWGSLLP